MTSREFFVETVKDELPRFERMFKALPADKLDWRPHEKSRSAMELAVTMAVECLTFKTFLTTGAVDFSIVYKDAPGTISDAWQKMSQGLSEAQTTASAMFESDWDSQAKMMSGDKVDWETSKGHMAWSLLLDLIHHRGQLSVYLRPMGGKVPAIYGPSGDSQG